jgi:alkanesulfonate monooxygenase SsuD/methylene tetrahydromethanopterin reductase-like flavin-dependent oxidoreductase (luciferase family)
MKYSVWPNMTIPTGEVLDRARWADERGYHGVWYADHYMPNTGSEEIVRGDTHECWAMLPAIAVVTERVRVGSLVSPTSVHHPAVLANRAVTVDHLSNGRMVLGLGAGWQINEHHAYGIELEPPKQRVDRFEEAITIIRSLLDDDTTDFHGELYDVTAAPCDPSPIQSPLPILVGTGGRRMMRLTARFAQEWNTWGSVDFASERREQFVAACESVDVDPASKRTSVQALVFLTDTQEQADEVLAGPMGSRSIAGTADTLTEQLHGYSAAGFDEFITPDFNLGGSTEERTERLERLHDEVLAPLIG